MLHYSPEMLLTHKENEIDYSLFGFLKIKSILVLITCLSLQSLYLLNGVFIF